MRKGEFMDKYITLKRKPTFTDRRSEFRGEELVGKPLNKETVLVFSPFGPPVVELLNHFEVTGTMVDVDELKKFNNDMRIIHARMEVYFDMFMKEATKQISVERIIRNEDATIVFFSDGDKEVVKKEPKEKDDHEKAVAIACAKKLLGGYDGLKKALQIYNK